jgi:2-iminobutanoate/2-iminopropanoate deaminase
VISGVIRNVYCHWKRTSRQKIDMHHPIINSDMPRPKSPYSQVFRADQLLFVSGQAGIDYATGKVVSQEFESQARKAFENLSTVLQASGSSLAHVVKTTVFLGDPANFGMLNQLFSEYFPKDPPARSTPITNLPIPELAISIEAVAVLP